MQAERLCDFMKGLSKLLNTKYGHLIFGLICGVSYFIISLNFIFANTVNAAGLLAFYLSPLIICGIALVVIKLIKNWTVSEQYKNINLFVHFHLIVFIVAVIFAISFCLYGIN